MISKSANKLSTIERRRQILVLLEEQEIVSVKEFCNFFGVSTVTIRKDLDCLALENKLERTHGGATRSGQIQHDQSFVEKISCRKDEKKRIAAAAARLIPPGSSVIMNSGSTAYYVAQEIKSIKDIIVITNSFHILGEIGYSNNVTTVFLGGRFDSNTQLTYDEDAVSQLSRYKADFLIMGMDGVDILSGATTYEQISASILKQMLRSAKKNILVADWSKIGKAALVQICNIEDFHVLITNETPQNEAILRDIENRGVQVITV